VHFGLFLPPFAELADPKVVASLATHAEESGWDGVFLWDHMLARPGVAVADAWVTMAAIAVATTRLRFGAMVTPLPRRRPWVLARQMATLDQLSDGRLIGGIGLGDDGWTEFSSFGEEVDPVVRGEMLNESLELLRRFLSGMDVHFEGRHFTVNSSPFLPRPQQDPLPIWGAVRWPRRNPLTRIATLQGCFPIFAGSGPPQAPDPADIFTIRDALNALGARPDMDIVVRIALAAHDASKVRETVAALENAGVTWILEAIAPGAAASDVADIARAGPPHPGTG
jgi:alkanesulfonate monooxygenase SsuD/methylene tetrahydromethanopterin reductase-like flavin-dependent oxidoreductase (luciferase family)